MKIGLIDVDSHHFPNLALMKIAAYHKAQGNPVDWWNGFEHYDRVYVSRVFDDTYSTWGNPAVKAEEVIYGGTGFDLKNRLPDAIEHTYPDYALYPALTNSTAYGFLTRGCPRGCEFCIVAQKEGRCSRQVADLPEFWRGQQIIKLLDPNLLACKDHPKLLLQLAKSGVSVDFTQGLDIRLTVPENIDLLNRIKIHKIHFAWDSPDDDLIDHFQQFMQYTNMTKHRRPGVYVLTNFGSTLEQDLYRIYTLRNLGYDPYVMIYDKPHAPRKIRLLQRWCNNRLIFRSEPDFKKYDPKRA